MNLIEFIKHPAYNYYITTLVHDCLLSDLTNVLLSCYYNIKWEQVSCLKGIRLEDVTPELDSKAYVELKNNKH